MIKTSEKRICACENGKEEHVYIDRLELENHELESVIGIYCISCNSFWREPW